MHKEVETIVLSEKARLGKPYSIYAAIGIVQGVIVDLFVKAPYAVKAASITIASLTVGIMFGPRFCIWKKEDAGEGTGSIR